MVAALSVFGLDGAPPAAPVTHASALNDIYQWLAAVEVELQGLFAALYTDLPPVPGVETRTVVVTAGDHDINLHIHRPASSRRVLPCVYYIHGGAMVALQATDVQYTRLRDELAALDLVVVGVEFRNGAGKLGNHPFPAGLDDCLRGLDWTFENRGDLEISTILVAGESGGGNLALALTLKAKREGKIDRIGGTYAMCPYISNQWASTSPSLPSLDENDGYFFNSRDLAAMAVAYDPSHENDLNPLCWPYAAGASDLHGLPPHVIAVNELDPLRDEGLAYFRTLLAAGVPSYSRTINGTCHAGDLMFRKAMPELYASTIHDIRAFAEFLHGKTTRQ